MKIFSTCLVAITFLIANISAQVPCVNGMAGNYPCSGYDLQSNMTLEFMGVEGQGNDIWGWTDPLDGREYALYGARNRATFIDISAPCNPIFVGYMETQTDPSTWRDIKVYNNYAFIVSEANNHGMQVFDLTKLRNVENMPMEFEPDAFIDDMGAAHNIVINEESGYAYAVGADTFDGGPSFIDISDPLNPVTVGGYDGDGYTHDAQVVMYSGPDVEHQGKEIFFGFNADALTIVDVTDKTDPIQLSRTQYGSTGYTHQGWLDEGQTLIYLGDETDEGSFGFNTRTVIFDVSNLDMPAFLEDHFGETTATDHNMYVKDDLIYQANYTSGLRVLQINDDPNNRLEEVGYFDVFPAHNEAGYSGTWSVYPYFESGNIIINSRDEGLFVVNPSTEESCVVIGVDEIANATFGLSPNPVVSELTISLYNGLTLNKINIVDVSGRIVTEISNISANGSLFTIPVSNLKPGIYFLNVNDSGAGERFIVE
ncbi:MAG: choice-of-anchor B domain-containing protein [Patiriisocius sp.]|jgi:choice-of-anchor B domain-containing protein